MSRWFDYPITFRGKQALASATFTGNRVSIASLRIEGDVDHRGQPVVQTFHGELDAQGHSTALGALPVEERESLFAQVRSVAGA